MFPFCSFKNICKIYKKSLFEFSKNSDSLIDYERIMLKIAVKEDIFVDSFIFLKDGIVKIEIHIDIEQKFDYSYNIKSDLAFNLYQSENYVDSYEMYDKILNNCENAYFCPYGESWWFDNPYEKISPKNTVDVSIPDESHLKKIEEWLNSLGFKDIAFRIKVYSCRNICNIIFPSIIHDVSVS